MKVSAVTNEDGRLCAQLINFLKAGRWDLSGVEAEELAKTRAWIVRLAQDMARDLSPRSSSAPDSEGFSVKSMGSLPSPTSKASKSTSKSSKKKK